ncbi:hypothetical protein BJ165DRAFT_1003679 [Panaeolus papilionaceus]|nr:hypothetical protein BJ165DRAFT_1003679 [Panaeolus papilionaceus]
MANTVRCVNRSKLLYFTIKEHRIMGPTGAGKSTFIELLGSKDELQISSDQLDGFTQTVSTYEVKNARYKGRKIFLVDSPGFADRKISEMEIVSLLQNWIKTNGGSYFSCILYLTPITHTRLPGSQRQVLKTFEALTGVNAVRHITVVTTMWDCIWSDNARRRADATFEQLRSDIWKNFIDQGAHIVKFDNTADSALSILGDCLRNGTMDYVHFERMLADYVDTMRDTPFAVNVYNDLQNRVQNLHLQRASIQSDLQHARAQADEMLISVLVLKLEETEQDLAKFQQQLDSFGPPRVPVSFIFMY